MADVSLTDLIARARLESGLRANAYYDDDQIVRYLDAGGAELADIFTNANQHYVISTYDFTTTGPASAIQALPADFQQGHSLEIFPDVLGQTRTIRYLSNWLNRNAFTGMGFPVVPGGGFDPVYTFLDNKIRFYPPQCTPAAPFRLYYTPQWTTLALANLATRPGQKVVLDGDSVTAGLPDVTYRWSVQWEASLAAYFTGLPLPAIANTALGGNTTADCLARVALVIAQNPDHVFIMVGINDHFNHGGVPILPAQSAANMVAYMNAIRLTRPTVRFHFISGVWYSGENWPLGVNADDATVTATLNAIHAVVDAEPAAEWIEIRETIFNVDEPINNPTHLLNGILTQGGGDGTHPSKPLGTTVISQRVFERTSLSKLTVAASPATDTRDFLPAVMAPWAEYLVVYAAIAINTDRQRGTGELERKLNALKVRIASTIGERQEEPQQPPLTRGSWDGWGNGWGGGW